LSLDLVYCEKTTEVAEVMVAEVTEEVVTEVMDGDTEVMDGDTEVMDGDTEDGVGGRMR
jgi:hypothetical protein